VWPGSVLTVNLASALRRFRACSSPSAARPDTSFVLRNVVQRTGVEMQFFVNSPHVKEIVVVSRRSTDGKKKGKASEAKLFYLRDSPERIPLYRQVCDDDDAASPVP